LLAACRRAEAAGFDAAMSSDHFSPWSARQGHSAFAWSWPGAALQATSLPFGVVNAPGQRYHPAIIVQAISTLTEMYPEAEALAHDQWRSNVFPPPVCWDVDTAETFDLISEDVTLDKVRTVVNVSADLGAHTALLAEYAELGFDKIMLHHVGQEQDAFIDAFGAKVLPQLRSAA
jgi:hypothetical protein